MGLHLGAELVLDDDIGIREPGCGIAARAAFIRAADIALLRQRGARRVSARKALTMYRMREDAWRVGLPCIFEINHECKRLIIDFD